MRIILITFLFSSLVCFGQTSDKRGTIKVKKEPSEIKLTDTAVSSLEVIAPIVYTDVEQMPEFPGGNGEMYKYIAKNVKYPVKEKGEGIQGTVYITFVVEEDGSIANIKILRGVSGGPGIDAEALRVVASMPKWSPGKLNGRVVKTQFNLPIKFHIG